MNDREMSLCENQVTTYLDQLNLADPTLCGNYQPGADADINLTGLGERVLDEFVVDIDSDQERDVFYWVYEWSLAKGYLIN